MKQGTKTLLWSLVSAAIGLTLGAFLYAQTVERANVVASACVAVTQAVDKGWVTREQVRDWGNATGQVLQRDYGWIAKKLRISDEAAQAASADSLCSQFLLGVHSAGTP